jgi:hypothetical protein
VANLPQKWIQQLAFNEVYSEHDARAENYDKTSSQGSQHTYRARSQLVLSEYWNDSFRLAENNATI